MFLTDAYAKLPICRPQDLELALRKFESGGLAGIVELEGSIETAKQTHMLIQQAGLGVRPMNR